MAPYPPMTVTQTAAALGVSRQRVLALIKSGALPAKLQDGRWQVDRDAVDARAGLSEATLHWLTVKDVAAIHSVRPEQVRRWYRAGLIPAMRALQDNALLFRPEDVAAFVPPRRGRFRNPDRE